MSRRPDPANSSDASRRGLAWAIVLAASLVAPAGGGAQEPESNGELLWHETASLVPVRVTLPADFDPGDEHTLVVGLHGFGASAARFQRVADDLASTGLLVALPESPYAFLNGEELGYDWYLRHADDSPATERARRLLISEYLPGLIERLRDRYRLDSVYLLGFSQGARVAMQAGLSTLEDLDGVITFGMSSFDRDWVPDREADSGTPRILLFHGDQDRPRTSQLAYDSLRTAGYDATWRPFRGGHTVPTDLLIEAAAWIREGNR